jgi:hypothetical protein
VLPEWLEAGLIGAFVVAAVFFVHDSWTGMPLHTVTALGTLLMEGPHASQTTAVPGAAAVYNTFHFGGWIVMGLLATRVMRLADDDPYLRWLPPACLILAVGILGGLDWIVRDTLLARAHLWFGGMAGLVAMGGFLIWRHPGALGH